MAAIIMIALLAPAIAFPQRWPVVTLEGGYQYGMRLRVDEITTVRGRHERTDLPVLKDHNSTVRMGVGLLLPPVLGSDIELETRATAGYSLLAMRRELDRVKVMIPPDQMVDQIAHYDVSARMTTLGLDFLARRTLLGGLYAELGVWSTYRVNSNFKRYYELMEPDNAQFTVSDSTVALLEQGTDFSASPVSVGPVIGFGYDVPLFGMLKLRPNVRLHADINSIINYDRPFWRDFSLGGGIGMALDGNSYAGFGDFPPLDAPDADEPPDRPLQAFVDLYCRTDSGEQLQTLPVRRSVTLHRGYLPFISSFQWDSGSESIPERYTLLSSAGQFTPNSIAAADPLQAYHNGLNMLGMRLRRTGGSTVRLVGGTAAGEPAQLGLRRAEHVREYLREVWGVNPSRVKVESEHGHGAYVRVAGAARDVTAPVPVEWRSEDLNAPQIGVSPSVEGGAGLKSWELVIRHGRRDVVRQSSGGGSQDALDMGLILRNLGTDTSHAELTAELTVIDSAGERAVAHDRLPILVDMAAAGEERTRTLFVLLPPGDKMSEAISPPVDSIIAVVRKGSRISVHYRRQPATAAEPAMRHAEQVAGRLRASLQQRGLGHLNPELIADDAQQEGSSAEAAMFDAAVTVVVEGSL